MTQREQLEIKIAEASEGELTPGQITRLEEQLKAFPDLLEDYHAIMQLPELNAAFTHQPKQMEIGMAALKNRIKGQYDDNTAIFDISLTWFRRYAVAASILIAGLATIFTLTSNGDDPYDFVGTYNELFFPETEADGEEYVIYLEEFYEL